MGASLSDICEATHREVPHTGLLPEVTSNSLAGPYPVRRSDKRGPGGARAARLVEKAKNAEPVWGSKPMSLHQCDQHVLVHIAYSLDCASIASLRLTSRELHRLLSCDALWRVVFLRQWPCSVSEVVTRVAPTSWLAEVSTRGALMRALRTNAMGTLQSPAWGTLIAICDTPAHRATVRRHIATGVSRHGAACWDADTLHVQSRRFLARCFQGCGSGEDSEDSTNLAKTLLKTLRWCNDQFVSVW